MTIFMSNMTIFMSPEYSCLHVCYIDDAKVIVIDRICTCLKLIFQPESNKHRTKTGNQKHTARRREIKTIKVVQRRRNHKNKRKKT
ncbi:cysteine protease, putative [Medicago truncatula]|uniref:Cysteine protease, putative n=1 Tax=Medicago truncatula TaxID=3880 RepID=G7JL16_MEDTR|nr:cysteine protease, putative [Medicago truncatula]